MLQLSILRGGTRSEGVKGKGPVAKAMHKFKNKDEINGEDEVQVGCVLQLEVIQTKVDVQRQARENDMSRNKSLRSPFRHRLMCHEWDRSPQQTTNDCVANYLGPQLRLDWKKQGSRVEFGGYSSMQVEVRWSQVHLGLTNPP
jgi:hypothetical protein